MSCPVPLLVDPCLHDLQAVHAFTTRRGGVATGPVASLTLARSQDVTDAELVDNWGRVMTALGVASHELALVNQVHGDRVTVVQSGRGPLQTLADADALVTCCPGVALAVRVADCLPVILLGPGVVGVAHAGWRGAAAGIAVKTADAMCALVGCERADLRASLGPCISAASYETGPGVVEALTASGVPRQVAGPSGPWSVEHADIRGTVAVQLEQVGVCVSHVHADTATDDRMFSHRRDAGRTGRQAAVVALRA